MVNCNTSFRHVANCNTSFRHVAIALALLCLLPRVLGAPFSPDDSFKPICGSLISGTPAGGWQLWSSSATWRGGVIPGVGAGVGSNVTIPCGVGILLDVPNVQLTLLDIRGSLRFKDDPSLPFVNLTAAFIIVQGRFIIGTPSAQFSQKAFINLTPNPNNREPYLFTANAPADPSNPRNLGHKAFVVVGGQVDLHGLPGPAGMLTWTKLLQSASAGDTSIVVGGDVSGWPVGAPIVIAPTDFFPDQEDVAVITQVTPIGNAKWRISLSGPITFNHFGDPLGVPDGFRGYVDETAEVALLTRNIIVTGADEGGSNMLEGGHFMVFMTNTQQLIEGVEFLLMGQQGNLGRYPLHFHLCGDQKGNSVIRKNLILHSKQRCIDIHATFNAYVDSNVAYNTSGHCFMMEEGSETGNTFINNLGIRTRAPSVLINVPGVVVSDNTPATFWITNPNNNYINNAAAGSETSGFWFQFGRFGVSGLSAQWSKVNNTVPINIASLGSYTGNSAHSNTLAGIQFYVNGYYPKTDATLNSATARRNPQWVQLSNFNLWKNAQYGAQLHNMDHVAFSDSTMADNPRGVHIMEAQGVTITRCRFVGQSKNYGNPSNCQSANGASTCGPVSGCQFPLPAGAQGRSVAFGNTNDTLFGVLFTENRQVEDGSIVSVVQQSTFSGYDSTCHVAAAVGVGENRADYWNSGNGFSTLRFDNLSSPITPAFLYPRMFIDGDGIWSNGGEVATFFALRDFDGSIVGGGGGYLVADNKNILPPSSSSSSPPCSFKAAMNAWACPGTCYRTLQISFIEPAYSHQPKFRNIRKIGDGDRVLGNFSYFTITRLADNSVLSVEGNLREYTAGNNPNNNQLRFFPVSLLGGYTYDINYFSGNVDPNFVPPSMNVEFMDGGGCGKGLTLNFKGAASGPTGPFSWSASTSTGTWVPCAKTRSSGIASASTICSTTSPIPAVALQLTMSSSLPGSLPIVLTSKGKAPGSCSSASSCNIRQQ